MTVNRSRYRELEIARDLTCVFRDATNRPSMPFRQRSNFITVLCFSLALVLTLTVCHPIMLPQNILAFLVYLRSIIPLPPERQYSAGESGHTYVKRFRVQPGVTGSQGNAYHGTQPLLQFQHPVGPVHFHFLLVRVTSKIDQLRRGHRFPVTSTPDSRRNDSRVLGS